MKGRYLLVLSVVGLAISVYLVAKTADPSSVACSIGGGCETVLSSDYAKIFGVSVAAYGALWYLAAIGLIWLTYFKTQLDEKYFKIWVGLGLAFSLYLLGLEIFVIHAYCTWCLASLAVVILITALTFAKKKLDVR